MGQNNSNSNSAHRRVQLTQCPEPSCNECTTAMKDSKGLGLNASPQPSTVNTTVQAQQQNMLLVPGAPPGRSISRPATPNYTPPNMAQRAAGQQLSQNVCGTYQRGSFFVFNPSPTIYQLPLTCCPNYFAEIVRAPCNLKSPLNSKWYGTEIANSICMLHWPEIRSLYILGVQTGNFDPVMLFLQSRWWRLSRR